MNLEPIHLHKNTVDRNRNIFLLFIPAVVFVFLVAFLIAFSSKWQLSDNLEKTVLGEEEVLDK